MTQNIHHAIPFIDPQTYQNKLAKSFFLYTTLSSYSHIFIDFVRGFNVTVTLFCGMQFMDLSVVGYGLAYAYRLMSIWPELNSAYKHRPGLTVFKLVSEFKKS